VLVIVLVESTTDVYVTGNDTVVVGAHAYAAVASGGGSDSGSTDV